MTRLHENPPPAEIHHSTHPHKLKLVTSDDALFKCDGCMEPGEGPRYTCGCRSSRFDLHTPCALAEQHEPTIQHPLFGDLNFKFLTAPPPPVKRTICDACGEPARGFVYHCYEKDLDLHPCCASLQPTITAQGGRTFELCHSSPNRCAFCRQKPQSRSKKFWAYRCRDNDGDVDLHVACMRKVARRTWEEAGHRRVGSGGGVVQACAPAMEAAILQSLTRNTRSSSGLDRIKRIVSTVASIVIAVIFGNPFAMIGALFGPAGFLRG